MFGPRRKRSEVGVARDERAKERMEKAVVGWAPWPRPCRNSSGTE